MLRSVVVALIFCVATGAAQAACQENRVTLRGDWGQAAFEVELAQSQQERAKGLMFRESMPRGSGMLFIFEHPQRVGFWMKNTLIPLDMIFADARGVVQRVHNNAIPGDLTTIDGGPGIYVVLEINAGLAQRYGIKPGTTLRHPAFDSGPAQADVAWPCD